MLAEAWRAAAAADLARLEEVAILAAAWRGTAEMALESEAQGRAFLTATRAAWPHSLLDALAASGETITLPVAMGAAAGAAEIPLELSLQAYLQSLAGNLVSAGLRLIPLGQTDGQRVVAGLAPLVAETAHRALTAELETAGSAAPLIDWCSMQHETQYTRLFRS
jgi:urease accessory protein